MFETVVGLLCDIERVWSGKIEINKEDQWTPVRNDDQYQEMWISELKNWRGRLRNITNQKKDWRIIKVYQRAGVKGDHLEVWIYKPDGEIESRVEG